MKNSKKYSEDIIKELYRAFDFFNKEFADGVMPRPLITIHRQTVKKAYGWFCANAWQDNPTADQINEITICQAAFAQGPDHVLETLIHEMAHLKNFHDNGKVVDCTRAQRHNKIFKTTAESFGLEVTSSQRFGFAHTALGEGAKKAIKKLKPNKRVWDLAQGLGAAINDDNKKKKKDRKKGQKMAPVIIGIETKKKISEAAKKYNTTNKELTEKAVAWYLYCLENNKRMPKEFQLETKDTKESK